MTLHWTRHEASHNLVAISEGRKLYSITRGGEHRKQFVLRMLPISTHLPAVVLGIHDREVDAKDEAERHNSGDKS